MFASVFKHHTDVVTFLFISACNFLIEIQLDSDCLQLSFITLENINSDLQKVWHDQNVSSGILFHSHCIGWCPQLWENEVVVKCEIVYDACPAMCIGPVVCTFYKALVM